MQTLLAILLYMQVIQSPGTYNQLHIDQLEMLHHSQIQIIMQDPVQMNEVNAFYLQQVTKIVIVSPDEGRITKPSGYFLCETDNGYFNNCQ